MLYFILCFPLDYLFFISDGTGVVGRLPSKQARDLLVGAEFCTWLARGARTQISSVLLGTVLRPLTRGLSSLLQYEYS
jgi:hypothetical protein